MRQSFLSLLLVLSLSTPAAHAGICSDALSSVKKYALEVRESRGLRLLVAPSKGDPPERFYGFVSARGWPAPFSGLFNVLADKPSNAVVRAFAGPEKKASLLVKFPVILGWALLAQVYVIDPVTDYAFDSRIQSEIAENRLAFDRLIEEDYRFDSIRRALITATMAREEAERQAYMVARAYSSYYKYRDSKNAQFSDEDNDALLDHYLFAHLKSVLENGVQVPSDFRVSSSYSQQVTAHQRQRLFQLTHALYMRYQILDAYVKGDANPALQEAFKIIRQDPFSQQAENLWRQGRIDKGHYQRVLQERAYWSYRLQSYGVLGLQKLHPQSGQPVTLADYDVEILADL
ncbi:MAG: hypothetical protein KF799_08480 [Bdellovibrionales bacterium]|nr:hypothetical protein [Bdellovibrionales bacterium]